MKFLSPLPKFLLLSVITTSSILSGGLAKAQLILPSRTIGFETNESPAGTQIQDQFWRDAGVRFRGSPLTVGEVGPPLEAFRGYLELPDRPYPPGFSVGTRFVTGGIMQHPGSFLIEYRHRMKRVGLTILDVNESESWRADAFDSAGNHVGSIEVYPVGLPGVPLTMALETASHVITSLHITFTGQAPARGITFAFDNIIGASEPRCPADVSLDGMVDMSDYLQFFTDLDEGAPQADLNGDGFIEMGDLLLFISAFDQGC